MWISEANDYLHMPWKRKELLGEVRRVRTHNKPGNKRIRNYAKETTEQNQGKIPTSDQGTTAL
jgi:response regulator RpfG family c-di-GMP phosphodiesterase